MTNEREPGVVDALGLLPTYGGEIVLDTVRDTHRAWADRTYGALNRLTGNRARGPQAVHDAISSVVYASIGVGLGATRVGLRTAGTMGAGPRLDDGPRGRFVRSALNGILGDRFAEEESRLAISMGVRRHGSDVPLEPVRLAQAFPKASGRIAVFLHGLSENESYFDRHREQVGSTYPELLASMGWTPVMLRANTGLPVRTNGIELAALLRDLVAVWPVEVEQVALVGHSMGGLIMRAASAVVAAGAGELPPWTRLVSDVITLGTPHHGAPIAIGLGHGSRLLARLPETSAFGRILDNRSVGVADLVDGLGEEVPALPRARYRLVAATLTGSPRHPVGHVVGDLMVRVPSAHGRSRGGRELFPGADVVHVPRTDHFGLLNHPDVHSRLKEWLE
ncbi:MAG: hypothetical protein L0H93_10735 [Nocardioides sp.]|nr:hypothetical protein [Nocardioides sp.]